jgi:hypothetical protein
VACPTGSKRFTLHGILMWAIHDLLTYGLLSGQVTKGYKGCPAYGPNTGFHHFRALGKIIYCQHCKLLPLNHPFRSNSCDLDGKVERKPLPPILTKPKVLEHATIYEAWKSNGMKEDSIPCNKLGMKEVYFIRPSILEGMCVTFQIFNHTHVLLVYLSCFNHLL